MNNKQKLLSKEIYDTFQIELVSMSLYPNEPVDEIRGLYNSQHKHVALRKNSEFFTCIHEAAHALHDMFYTQHYKASSYSLRELIAVSVENIVLKRLNEKPADDTELRLAYYKYHMKNDNLSKAIMEDAKQITLFIASEFIKLAKWKKESLKS